MLNNSVHYSTPSTVLELIRKKVITCNHFNEEIKQIRVTSLLYYIIYI